MIWRKLKKLGALVQVRHSLWEHVRATLSEREWREAQGPFLPQESAEYIIERAPHLKLVKPQFQNGNVSPLELLTIAALVASRQPEVSIEIGTFDGNTTLQIAANSSAGGKVLTLDLPLANVEMPRQAAPADLQFIESAARQQRRFAGGPWAQNIVEMFGDSMSFDFRSAVNSAPVDLAFIDGSHSYDYVKGDTERILPLLKGDAIVIWHDYCRAWTGVVKYLHELAATTPLRHVTGTSIVFLDRKKI